MRQKSGSSGICQLDGMLASWAEATCRDSSAASIETILTFSDLHRFRAPLIVVNADYQRLRPASTTERQILASLDQGDLGYRLIYSQRFEVPWQAIPGLHPALVGERRGPVLSNLHHVNPRMEIFARDGN